ncbi:NAD+ synthase [Candidatus Woesearchaeota archaeon]|nr:NAD+ synthase [Candidatus Woesearchaeota archaeon]
MGDLIQGIKDYFKKSNCNKAVIGLSGGIDSSLALVLTAKALGNKNIHAILMPEKGVSKRINVEDAVKLCKELKVKYNIIEISKFLKPYKKLKWKNNLATTNTKARIRANILYSYANSKQALVIGTSNKTELLLGYGTKYGDLAADIFILASLYKTEIFKLAKKMNLSENIINKTPSAELYKGQTDESELGASYKEIDQILKLTENKQLNKIKNKELFEKIKNRINNNKHKRTAPIIIK